MRNIPHETGKIKYGMQKKPHMAPVMFFSCQSCLTFRDPMDCSTPGLPIPHHLLEFAQVHIDCISDAI